MTKYIVTMRYDMPNNRKKYIYIPNKERINHKILSRVIITSTYKRTQF